MSKQSPRSPREQRLLPPANGLTIRMYRQGLGDCFLLAFTGARETGPSYVLIDCGVHGAQSGGRQVIRQVVSDLVTATGGTLDLVVATHEHTDHLSAFQQEAATFLRGELAVKELWLAWTEDGTDPAAQALRRGRGVAKRAIEKALERLHNQAHQDRSLLSLAQRVQALNSFSFDAEDQPPDAARALAGRLGLGDPDRVSGNQLAFAVLKECAKQVKYLRPGQDPQDLPGALRARAYVLGPPVEDRLLKRSNPASGSRQETYLAAVAGVLSFAASALDEGDVQGDGRELCFPFDSVCRKDYQHDFVRQLYGPGDDADLNRWRRIEDDWLHAAEELALQLDSHTNNTSLALAIELGAQGQGPVLLFPADAQVGSWLSWRGLAWRSAQRQVRIEDLFRRTLVYKVGHHASHNATLRRDDEGQAYGLELIPDGCIALVPVDQAAADKLDWGMPHPKLYQALKRKTAGNLLRSDDGRDNDAPTLRVRYAAVPGVEGARWRCSAKKKPDGTPLYYDLQISSTNSREP